MLNVLYQIFCSFKFRSIILKIIVVCIIKTWVVAVLKIPKTPQVRVFKLFRLSTGSLIYF